MRLFINFFLVGFALDAAVSVIDDFCYLLFDTRVLGPVRELLALAVLMLSVVAYLAPGIDSRLPKRLLLPPTLFAIWAAFGLLPFSIFIEGPALMPGASLAQLTLAVLAFLYIRRQTGEWLLPKNYFTGPALRLRNTLLYALGNAVLVPAAALLLLAASAYAYVRHETAGFMRIGLDGIYLEERRYLREGVTVRLIPMVHVGSPEYYRELGEMLSGDEAIVLAEGISDDEGLLKADLSYSGFADLIGLETQANMEIRGTPLEYEDIGANATGNDPPEPGIVRADVDAGEFSDETRAYMEAVGGLFNSGDSFPVSFRKYMAWMEENMTPEKEEAAFSEIIDSRNETLLRYLDRALPAYKLILIPWGALHMPGLEQALLERGFSFADSERRLAIDFDDIFAKGSGGPAPGTADETTETVSPPAPR